MNPDLGKLLSLDDLTLTRRGMEFTDAEAGSGRRRLLDERIARLRRKMPGELLSVYDRLARRFPDVVTVISDGECQGCRQQVSVRLAILSVRSEKLLQCEHCGRFVMNPQNVPDYLE